MAHGGHVHHDIANDWYESLDADVRFGFCRHTQLGFLRLLTSEAVMGEGVMNQTEAWQVYDQFLAHDRIDFVDEPPGLERRFRALTRRRQASAKTWGDAYLAAFAETSQLTLVTFDAAFRGKVKPLVLLAEAED